MSKAANIKIKPVELELNGEKYLIKYDFNALIELEDLYGSVEDAMEAMSGKKVFDEKGAPVMEEARDKDGKDIFEADGVTAKMVQKRKFAIRPVRDFLWAGLLLYRNTITKEEVSNLLDFPNLQFIIEKLTEAINAAMPATKIEDDVKN